MNSESARKSPQELKNQARQALREAERTVTQVTVMEHNWVGLINCLKMQIQMLENMEAQMESLTTDENLRNYMNQQMDILRKHGNITVQKLEDYQSQIKAAAQNQTEQMEKAASRMQSQAGKISEQFSEKLSEVTQQQKRYTRKLFWISLIPALITLVSEWMPHIWPQG